MHACIFMPAGAAMHDVPIAWRGIRGDGLRLDQVHRTVQHLQRTLPRLSSSTKAAGVRASCAERPALRTDQAAGHAAVDTGRATTGDGHCADCGPSVISHYISLTGGVHRCSVHKLAQRHRQARSSALIRCCWRSLQQQGLNNNGVVLISVHLLVTPWCNRLFHSSQEQ